MSVSVHDTRPMSDHDETRGGVCVRACVRASVYVYACVCVYVCVYIFGQAILTK